MALMTMTLGGSRAMLLCTLVHTLSAVRAHTDADVHSGYTFVIDDLVWLTFFIFLMVLVIWAFCAIFPSSDPVPCRQYTPCPNSDRVIHVKIDQGCMPCAYKSRSRNPLTGPGSSSEGDPSAPSYQDIVPGGGHL